MSHRFDRLINFLADRLIADHELLSERWVLLPSLINKQYWMVELVKRLPGQAIGGVQFLSWQEALHRICSDASHIPDPLEIELRLAKLFLNEIPVEAKQDLEPLLSWLEAGQSSRFNTLARSLARQMMDAIFYGIEMAAPWQKKLYELLAIDGSWTLPETVFAKASFLSSVSQVHLFCTDEMPAIGWNFLISKASELSIYLFSPCSMYWEDSVSDSERSYLTKRLRSKKFTSSSIDRFENYLRDTHPLLANWGRLGRQTLHKLDPYSLPAIEAYDDEEEGSLSLLQMIQQDILFLRTAGETSFKRDPNDSSIQITAAGSSQLREIQILKDHILCFLKKTKASLSDVLVLAPDIRPYESIIQFVFGADLPIRIAPVALLSHNPYLQGWLLFFQLLDRHWEADAVLELFENAAFQAKHNLTSEELQWFRIWLKEAKVRGVLQARPGCWAEGLQRMVAGLVYLLPEEEPLARITSIDWGQADRLALLVRLIELLQKHLQAFTMKNRTLEEWVALLSAAAGELFESKENEEDLWSSFLRKLSMAAPYFPQENFSFSFIRSILEQDCQSATMAYQPLLIEAIQFSSLQNGALRSARALFLLGMDGDHFPKSELSSTLNWECPKPNAEDRDRYLFLQAIFSAEEQLSISYCHLSAHDGKSIEPALPVQELIQTIDDYYPLPTPQKLIVMHPALPYDTSYFQENSPLRSFSMEAYRASSAPAVPMNVFWPLFGKRSLEGNRETKQFNLSDLALLAKDPWRYFLQRRMGIYLKKETLFSELRRGDLTLASYQENKILKLSLHQDVDELLSRYAHELPPNQFGEWAKVQIRRKAIEWRGYLEKWSIAPDEIFSISFSPSQRPSTPQKMTAPPIALTIADLNMDVEIVGEIDLLTPSGLLMTSELNLAGILRFWPASLAFQTLYPSGSTIYSLKKGASKNYGPMNAHQALIRWVRYALHAEESLSPLIYPWIDLFLKKSFEEWREEAQKSVMKEKDLTIRWILERSQPFPYEEIWKQWRPMFEEVLPELISEKEDAVV